MIYSLNPDVKRAIVYQLPSTESMLTLFESDKHIKQAYRVSLLALNKSNKYRLNSTRYKLKKMAIQNEFLDNYIQKLMVLIHIKTNLKNTIILNYHKQSRWLMGSREPPCVSHIPRLMCFCSRCCI